MAALPRASASLIVTAPHQSIAHNYRVLLVQRVSKGGNFDGAHVFPGGIEEDQDHSNSQMLSCDAHKLCAIRETFEETGLLFTTPIRGQLSLLDIARDQPFHAICAKAEAQPLDPHLFARWITPRAQSARFDTRFYMLNIANDNEFLLNQLASGSVQTKELVKMGWFSPSDVLQANMRGEMPLFPPQFSILHEMSRYKRWQDLAARYSGGSTAETAAIESHPVEPVLRKRSDGAVVALLPGDVKHGEDVDDDDLFCIQQVARGKLRRLTMRPTTRAGSGGFEAISLIQTAGPIAGTTPHL
ncbi:hypothetical protein EV175_003001 [Coemansia sp. RSA 1933]|nr:hypothetical protein EV175_003001 [Coemansia sp. RSA 1933]